MKDYTNIFKEMHSQIYELVDSQENKRLWLGGDLNTAPYFLDYAYSASLGHEYDGNHITALRIKDGKLQCFVDFTTDAEMNEEEEFWECFETEEPYDKQWLKVNDVLTIVSIYNYVSYVYKNYKDIKHNKDNNNKTSLDINKDFEIIL